MERLLTYFLLFQPSDPCDWFVLTFAGMPVSGFSGKRTTINNTSTGNHTTDWRGLRLAAPVADFTQQLSEIHDRHSEELQVLVEAFRKRNAEIRKERAPYQSTLFSLWELLLQEVEAESHSHGEISRFLSRNLGNGLLEKTFHKKIQSRKAFLHRESVEAILNKANEALETVRQTFLSHSHFLA